MQKSDEGVTVSYWEATEELRSGDVSGYTVDIDICIVGAGISGLTTAYKLARSGRKVAVIDDGLIGGGETCRTTAHLSNAIDDRIYRIEEWHGEDSARLAVEAHTRAIDTIESIARDEDIDCDFLRVSGYLVETPDGEDDLDKELEAAHRSGLTRVQWAESVPIGGYDRFRSLIFPDQGQFHVLKYLNGLAQAVERDGGLLISNARCVDWEGGDRPSVKTANGRTITCNSLVLATNYPLMSKMFAELPAYRTYVIGVELPPGTLEPALIWDNEDPYHYIRIQIEQDHQILIVGGEDHKTGQEDDGEERFAKLLAWTQERFPSAQAKYKWSGQVLETNDGLAFIGRYSSREPNVYLIAGDSGMGMTHGTIGGMLVSDLIIGRENAWEKVFLPSRLATQSITEAVPEILQSTAPYVDWITGGDVSSEEDIVPGMGAIIRKGLSKLAVYKDEDGTIYRKSAVCKHLGCLVRFNSLEKTWDCPCHGSRYSVAGEPINAPAYLPLDDAE